MTAADLLEERISDIALRRKRDPAKVDAVYAALAIALPTILRAASAGNVQCKEAVKQLNPHITILLQK